jgi:Concanavalin A-like lectin/glucanases superfamily
MSYIDIYNRVAALGTIVRGTVVTIDRTLLGDARTSDIMLQTLGTDTLSLSVQYYAVASERIELQGFCTLLHITDAELKVCIDTRAGDPTVVIEVALPSAWKFSTSYPDLPGFLSESKGSPTILPNVLDTLGMGASRFIFSNRDFTDAGVALVRGLNFAGNFYYSGMLMGLGNFIDFPGPVPMSGQIHRYVDAGDPAYCGVVLDGDLQYAGSIGALEIASVHLRIKSAVLGEHLDWTMDADRQAGVYFVMQTRLMGRDMEVIGRFSEGKNLDLSCEFTDFLLPNLNTINQSTGGADGELQGSLPSEMAAPSGLQITDMALGIDFKARSVRYVSLGLGMQVNWDVVPGAVELADVGLRVKVGYPFESSKRMFQVSLLGSFILGSATVGLAGTYPGYEVSGYLLDGTLRVGEALTRYLPGVSALSEMTIHQLVIMASPTAKSFTLVCDIQDLVSIPVGTSNLEVQALKLFLNRSDQTTTGRVSASMALAGSTCEFAATMANQLVLSGNARNVSFHELLATFTGDAPLPEELPEVLLDTVTAQYTPHTGDMSITAVATLQLDTLPFDSKLDAQLALVITRTSGNWTVQASLSGTGSVQFADGFSLESFNLAFSYSTTTGWSLSGTLSTKLFDKALNLAASYKNQQGIQKFTLSAILQSPAKLMGYEGLFMLYWSRLDMSIERTTPAVGAATKSWALRLDGEVQSQWAQAKGIIEIVDDGKGTKGLSLKNTNATWYTVPLPNTDITVGIMPKQYKIEREASSNPSAAAVWRMVGAADLKISNVPGKLGKQLPEKFLATLTLSKTGTKIELNAPFTPFDFPLPAADGQSLGKMVLQINKIGVALLPSVGLTTELGLGFPAELNVYLKNKVFREYVAGNVMTMAVATTTIGAGGIDLKFTTSPFQSGNVTKATSGEDWINLSFGEYGEIALKMPSFKYSALNSYFEASGGFKIIRPLSIPLTPLRNFLDAVGMGAAKAIFPEKLPVKGISLIDSNNNFKTEDLIKMLGSGVPSDVKTALRGAGNLLNRFPDNFKSYLKFEIPTQLEFKFGFSPLGRVALGLSAPVEPIRFLYPGMVQGLVPMPGLIGIELRKLNVGTLASGSLFFGEIDAVVDMYDLPSLVTSLALPRDPAFPLPTSDQLTRRILLRNVFSIIPLSQGVPVPVPVFYDELGFEYKGLEGIGLQAHMGIPQPDFAAGGTALLQTLTTFFKDRNSKLDPNTPPGGQQIKFKFRDEYLEAPEYLGGGKVGTWGTTIEIGTWKYVAQLMNFCKRFALQDFIAAIPTENRMANKTVKFACFEVDGQYMITTPEEFDGGGYQALNLTAAQQQDFHDVLPGVQTGTIGAGNGSSGLVMFLRGGVKASTVFDLQASFGLAASGTMGFNTGFKFKGKVGGVVEAELKGALLLNARDLQNSVTYPASSPVEQAVVSMPVPRGGGKVLSLSGFNSWIEAPHSPSLLLRQWSVELWVKLETPTSDWVGLFGKPGRDFAIYVSKQGALQGYVNRAFEKAAYAGGAPNGTIAFNTWQHIAYTYDGSTMRFYRNGTEVGNYAFANEINANATMLYVGRDLDGSFPKKIVGCLSDVRLWRRPRSGAEIARDYQMRLTGHEPSLVAYYPLDSDTGEQAVDATGLNHGKICNGTFVGQMSPFPESMRFDGVDDQVRIAEINGFKPGQSTIQIVASIDADDDDASKYFLIGTANGLLKVHADLTMPSLVGSLASIRVRIPHRRFVTITVVSTTTTRTTYINGVLSLTQSGTYSATPGKFIFYLGMGNNNATGTVPLRGAISEVSIWNDCKTPAWIQANVQTSFVGDEPDLLVSYKLWKAQDGKLRSDQGTFPAEVIGQQYSTPVATATPLGLRLATNTQYAVVPSNSAFSLPAYTIEFWMRADEKSSRSQFPLRFPAGSPRIPYINGVLSHRWSEAGGATISIDAPASTITVGQWTHVAVTHTGTVGALYINGQKIGEKTSKQLVASASELILGRQSSTDSTNNFVGGIDEVRLWSMARTQTEIVAGMGAVLSGSEAGLIADYRLAPIDGDTMRDSGPKKLHGSIVGLGLPHVETAPAQTGRSLVQAYGHAHLKIGSQEIMVADLRIADNEFWFRGKINLFPPSWPVQVYGDAEGVIGKDKLYLASSSKVQLCGLTLAASRTLITHEQVRLEGKWLGVYTLIDVKWAGDEPRFKGAMEAQYDARLDIGAVYIKGVRVCDGLQLDLSMGFKVALDFDRTGFGATVGATFKINGVGFSASFTVKVAPDDLDAFARLVRDEIARNAEKYLSHLFKWAVDFAAACWNGTLQFLGDTWGQIAGAFSKAYGKAAADAAVLWKQVGGTIDEVASLLNDGYKTGLTQASNILKGMGYDIVATSAAIKKFLGDNYKELIDALDEAFADLDVVNLLKNQYGKSMQQIAGWHKELAYATSKTYEYIKTAFGAADKELSQVMKNIGYTCNQVGDMLKNYMSGEEGAKILKEIGFSKNDVEGALVSSWNWSKSKASDFLDTLLGWIPGY